MKALLLTLLATTSLAFASHLGVRLVHQPIYLHGSDQDPSIWIAEVPFVTSYADPEWRFSAICQPFVPAADASWRNPGDVNLVSIYGIKVEGTYKKDSRDVEVVIDCSKAKRPEHYPFTLDQVVEAAKTCVRLMYPDQPKDHGQLEIRVVGLPSPAVGDQP